MKVGKTEHNIPLTTKQNPRYNGLTAKLRSLEIGDSFLADDCDPKKFQLRFSALTRRLKPKKFASRTLNDSSLRIWRIL